MTTKTVCDEHIFLSKSKIKFLQKKQNIIKQKWCQKHEKG